METIKRHEERASVRKRRHSELPSASDGYERRADGRTPRGRRQMLVSAVAVMRRTVQRVLLLALVGVAEQDHLTQEGVHDHVLVVDLWAAHNRRKKGRDPGAGKERTGKEKKGNKRSLQDRNMIVNMQMRRHASRGPTSSGVLSLQAFGIHYMDLSDQLRVATHPRPTCLRRVIQSQLSGKERVHISEDAEQEVALLPGVKGRGNDYITALLQILPEEDAARVDVDGARYFLLG
ncbi:hypothetical protein EYF80_027816 [Liparis tanakae]|uniref:Uncharacterized protein n=1 Tax=Liparis tanakae TaxID=230148 RepID=A0A4Z2H8Q2_9TELE|nr:hypothetical protein EYF80_027816 [Liparis tanakae]